MRALLECIKAYRHHEVSWSRQKNSFGNIFDINILTALQDSDWFFLWYWVPYDVKQTPHKWIFYPNWYLIQRKYSCQRKLLDRERINLNVAKQLQRRSESGFVENPVDREKAKFWHGQHHPHPQDNIFTVSFYTGREDGPLLGDVGGFSGY